MASSSAQRSSQRSERQNQIPHGRSAASSLSRSVDNGQQLLLPNNLSVRSKLHASRPSLPPTSRTNSTNHDPEPARVRVAVRLRPRNAEDLLSDADFADCVEIQPELKRLNLKKNNWSSEAYRFDEVFSESASQRRVYEAVAKPVVESVLSGYNGTVMAYGQTGTGKTYTLGRLGKDDASERGIMVRAVEDIISSTSGSDSIEISYLQLYLESLQDLLSPEKINIPISEEPKTGKVTLPGAVVVKVQDLDHFLQILQTGEANRHVANTKLNTESSRSHAILMVNIRRAVHEEENEIPFQEKDSKGNLSYDRGIPIVRNSKLLIVDLAGSERLDKSGSEGHSVEEAKFINLSLTSLGKCINALAENSPHIPVRDSKLTRLLRDSFGGSARTSLLVTIGPSSRHHAETTSTVMFGQRAMKVVNMLKLKEEFDYESLCRKLENHVDHLTAEIDRQLKLRDKERIEMERSLKEYQESFAKAEKSLVARSEVVVSPAKKSLVARSEFLQKENAHLEIELEGTLNELNRLKDQNNFMHSEVARLEISLKHNKQYQLENSSNQKALANTTEMYEKKIAELMKQLEHVKAHSGSAEELNAMKKLLSDHEKSMQVYQIANSTYEKALADTNQMYEEKIADLIQNQNGEIAHFQSVEEELDKMKKLLKDHQNSNQMYEKKIAELMKQLEDEKAHSGSVEEQLNAMKKLLSDQEKSMQLYQLANSTYQKALEDTNKMYEEKIADLIQNQNGEIAHFEGVEEELDKTKKLLEEHQNLDQMYKKKIAELMKHLQDEKAHSRSVDEQLNAMKKLLSDNEKSMQLYQMANSTYQKALAETNQMYEEKIADLIHNQNSEIARFEGVKQELQKTKKLLKDHRNSNQIHGRNESDKILVKLQESHEVNQKTANELDSLKAEYNELLTDKEKQRKAVEAELVRLKKLVPENGDDYEDKKSHKKENRAKPLVLPKLNQSRETISGQRATIAKICEEVGLGKILQLLTSGDINAQIRAVKVVANLAAEDINQEKIMEEGGIDALLMLLQSCQNITILRVASGAIANLAMNEANQCFIMNKGGARLLANAASKTDDPEALRMVAGAIANLCGSEKLQLKLRDDGAIKALLGMVRSGDSGVIAQVARGIANFAKCESREIFQGHRRGRSVLMEDNVLSWLIVNSTSASASSSRRNIELALCHLGQNEDNARDFISSGGVKALTRISVESSREDIRNLAKMTLKLSPTFKAEMNTESSKLYRTEL
ncbi:kinesin-like protein KIN-UA isoform X3 [Rhododendron vialii]|uniref:kinesin-like protein KIN-UA isoform X3 n=1 Tax=Rhododendron vialii TaxID=182163 RepID=UPI00265E421E|nr:kinesin-like protein KIN-UA isoform X3 [Rhododendron vialii]